MSKIDDLWAAYYKGQADAERDGILGQAVHFSAGHAMGAMLSIFGTRDEEIAYEKGYDGNELELCYECERVKEHCECDDGSQVNDSYSNQSNNYGSSEGSSSSSSDYSGSSYSGSDINTGSAIGLLIFLVIVVGGVILLGKAGMDRYNETKSWGNNRNQEIWTMMGVNTTMLNVRSGPGTNSPVIAKFERGARLATTGDAVVNGNEQWVRVSTDDGKVQGWANQKFLSTSPQLQEPNAPSPDGESKANDQSGEVSGQKSDNVTDGNSLNTSSKLSREKCQELIDLSFIELAVEIPPECTKQLEDHYKKLREKHNGKNGRQKEW